MKAILKNKQIGLYQSYYAHLPERTIPEKIYKIRHIHGLGIKSFATKLKVSTSSVMRWENGQIEPSRANLEKICTIFEIAPDYLTE